MIGEKADQEISLEQITLGYDEVMRDYRLALESRQASLIGRREVLSGKAKFGIFGDGKEVAQLALAKVFRKGDYRSGYYRGQTLMLALGVITLDEFFAQLYAHADVQAEPATAGRSMNAHFATRMLNPDGAWRKQTEMINVAADMSPTGAQMPRLVGLGYASRLYRELPELAHMTHFSRGGSEIAFGDIGNASCAEGLFWEAVNAIGVLQGPVVLSIWDDGYGISVTNRHQVTKEDLSSLLRGFQREDGVEGGFDIYTVCGWDYPALVEVYAKAAQVARTEHVPAIIHVIEMTQPQGHSTSGSHERYKSSERLAWEHEWDPIKKMGEWMVANGIADEAELAEMERKARKDVEAIRIRAWNDYQAPILQEVQDVGEIIDEIASSSKHAQELTRIHRALARLQAPVRKDVLQAVREVFLVLRDELHPTKQVLVEWKQAQDRLNIDRYNSHLYSEHADSALVVDEVKPQYAPDAPVLAGFEILNACFDAMLGRDPRVIAFGEDVGRLGDVNQGFAGLQAKYGELRVADTGIREATIIGQAIGLGMRGLRPIAEIQYLDYILYALQILSDDLASLRWRTKGGQKAPVIVRTRGHRLEGIWHSGSLMAGLVHLVRGMHVLVPRDMTRAAGFYNTLLEAEEPGIIVEVLNGYRLKEKLPENIGEIRTPLGVPEMLRDGKDITVVTYGAMCRIALETAGLLERVGIDVEIIDVQSLLPFDIHGRILESLKKTSRIVFTDEDVPGGTTAYMMQEVIEKQGGYHWLDAEPRTLPGKAHRPAYGTDGDYFSKPNTEELFETIYEIMHEADPLSYPLFYR